MAALIIRCRLAGTNMNATVPKRQMKDSGTMYFQHIDIN